MRVDARLLDARRVEVTVTNDTTEPVVVNRRLAPGYRESSSREVFVEVFDGDRQVAAQAMDYDRHPPQRDDYAEVGPGGALSTEIDLPYWYRLPGPGDYELVAHYQADEPLALEVPGLVRGTFASAPVPLPWRG